MASHPPAPTPFIQPHVLFHERLGVFLGLFMGVGLWSSDSDAAALLPDATTLVAPTFRSQRQTHAIIEQVIKMAENRDLKWEQFSLVPVPSAASTGFASQAQCREAGIQGW